MTSFYVSRVKVCREVFSLFHHYNCYEANKTMYRLCDVKTVKRMYNKQLCRVCFFAMKMKICLGVERFFWESRDFLRLRDFLWKLRDFFESWRLFWKLKGFFGELKDYFWSWDFFGSWEIFYGSLEIFMEVKDFFVQAVPEFLWATYPSAFISNKWQTIGD